MDNTVAGQDVEAGDEGAARRRLELDVLGVADSDDLLTAGGHQRRLTGGNVLTLQQG